MPTPSPTSLATLPMPIPLANSCRALDLVRLSARPAQFPTHLASLADEFAVAGELVPHDLEPGPRPLLDHRSFELAEGARDLEQVCGGCRRVDVLLVQVEIDADLFDVIDRAQQVLQRSA